MNCTIHEMAISALLHDIGKLIQRAFGAKENLDWPSSGQEAAICPTGLNGSHRHLHALFTGAFFDLIRNQGLSFPESLNLDTITAIASFHHQPENAPVKGPAWICALADLYSAGAERKSEDPAEPVLGKSAPFRCLPLKSIFDEISLDPKRPLPKSHAYKLDSLDLLDTHALIPTEWTGPDEALPEHYKRLWLQLWQDFTRLSRLSDKLGPGLFEETLAGLLERYTCFVPANTVDMADTSLFDHAMTTAAIAACLLRFHETAGDIDDIASIRDDQKPKFRFLAGDLSGLQQTLFTLEKQGVKGVNKILRARSFMLSAVAEAAVIQVLDTLSLPRACLVQQAGGRFLILTPFVPGADEKITALQARFDQWLLENYTGSLSLQMVFSKPFGGAGFQGQSLSALFDGLSRGIENAKQHPLANCAQGVLPRQFPLERACGACGVRPAALIDDEEPRCRTCQREFELGKKLLKAKCLVWAEALAKKVEPIRVLDLGMFLLEEDGFDGETKTIKSIRNLDPDAKDSLWALRLLSHYVPRLMTEAQASDPRYAQAQEEDFHFRPGVTKTFAHIGADALEPASDGKGFKGRPLLALLKADVDYVSRKIGLRKTLERCVDDAMFSYGIAACGL